jgi:ElaB/YqjD/DUF883 family membrane-anchored ribosome-binding protein
MDRSPSDRNTATTSMDETTELYREIDRLKTDLRQVRSDFASLGGDALRAARAGLNESVKTAAAKSKAVADGAEAQITSHPFIAVGTAFVVGLFVGLRLTRKG